MSNLKSTFKTTSSDTMLKSTFTPSSSLPTLAQIKREQRHNRLHVNKCMPYVISQEQYHKIHTDATLTHEEGVELLRACLAFNALTMIEQVSKEEAFFSAEQRFDIFMDKGMIVIQDEDCFARYRLFDRTAGVIKVVQTIL